MGWFNRELIDTLWNVNRQAQPNKTIQINSELIDTLWNVNIEGEN